MCDFPHSEFAVYTIANRVNSKRYVGKTIRGANVRFEEHKEIACHAAKSHFHYAIRKHGAENFEIVGYIGLGENFLVGKTRGEIDKALSRLEKSLIARLKTHNPQFGYNSTMGGDGVIPTEETRAKLSMSHKGQVPWMKGKTPSTEHRAKISRALIGKKLSPETRAKISAATKGKPVSQETRVKIRATLKGHSVSIETRAKMSAASAARIGDKNPFFGKLHSPETRAKISATKKTYYLGASPDVKERHRAATKTGMKVWRDNRDKAWSDKPARLTTAPADKADADSPTTQNRTW